LLEVGPVPFVQRRVWAGPVPCSVFHYAQGGVLVTILEAPGQGAGKTPGGDEGRLFLALYERVLDQFRPDILLTYGGTWLARAIMAGARQRGIRVVFSLRNFAYENAGELLRLADAVL